MHEIPLESAKLFHKAYLTDIVRLGCKGRLKIQVDFALGYIEFTIFGLTLVIRSIMLKYDKMNFFNVKK
jgi:hypothetical protein